jgi:hypothetical protein
MTGGLTIFSVKRFGLRIPGFHAKPKNMYIKHYILRYVSIYWMSTAKYSPMTSERAWATFLRLNDRPGDILFEVYSFLGPLVVDIGWRMSWTLTDRKVARALTLLRSNVTQSLVCIRKRKHRDLAWQKYLAYEDLEMCYINNLFMVD